MKVNIKTYFPSYSSAVQWAYDSAVRQGYNIDIESWAQQITFGRGKPAIGQTVRHSIELINSKKCLHIQVYCMRASFELNFYIN